MRSIQNTHNCFGVITGAPWSLVPVHHVAFVAHDALRIIVYIVFSLCVLPSAEGGSSKFNSDPYLATAPPAAA